jgi:diacylglycerol O-acyltransferase
LIEGHQSGHKIVFTKTHHACIDGVSGQELLAVLVDNEVNPSPVPAPTTQWKPEAVPNDLQMAGKTVRSSLGRPRHFVRMLPHVATSAFNMGKLIFSKERETPNTPFQAPRSIFNKPSSQHRDFAWGDIPLADVLFVKNSLGVKVNDLVMALCSTAMRRYCLARDALPETPLLSSIPISLHTAEGQTGNHVSGMFCSLATDEQDPLVRLEEIAKSTKAGKEGNDMIGAAVMTDAAQFVSPAIVSLANRYISGIGTGDSLKPLFNCVISNVPGPRQQLYMAGAKIMSQYPMSITTDNCGLNITLVSYMDKIDLGITTDKAVVPDASELMDYIKEALIEYKALATQMTGSSKPAKKQKSAKRKST